VHEPGTLDERCAWRGSGRILLVEDEPLVREVLQLMLEELGFEVIAASDGRSGVEAFRTHATELAGALIDEALGDMTGWDAFRRMREIRADVPALLCSGYPYGNQAPGLKANGWAGFLQKPFTPEGLADRLRAMTQTRDIATS
jgi:CheY-like chemotaxis protein